MYNVFPRFNKKERSKKLLGIAMATAIGVVSLPGDVWAGDGVLETHSDTGALYYTGYTLAGQQTGQTYFENGNTIQSTAPFKSIILSNSQLTLEYKNTGYKTDIHTAASLTGIIDAVNVNAGESYDRIVAVYKVSDGVGGFREETQISYISGGTFPIAYTHFIDKVNAAYFENPIIAAQIAAASEAGDTAALKQLLQEGLPRFYVTDADGTTKESLSIPDAGVDWDTFELFTPYIFVPYNIASTNAGAGEGYKYSYENKITLAENQIWRPLDRLTTMSGVGDWDYDINVGWAMDENGIIRETNATDAWQTSDSIHITNNADETPVSGATFISAKKVETSKGSMIDLSYLNTVGANPNVNNMFYTNPGNGLQPTGHYTFSLNGTEYTRQLRRDLYIKDATLADGTIFRVGSYGANVIGSSRNETRNIVTISQNAQDSVLINNAVTPDGNAKLYVQLGWVPGVGTATQGEGQIYGTSYPIVLGIVNGAENFTVEGQKSLADGIFSVYEITPTIGKLDNYYNLSGNKNPDGSLVGEQGSAWYLESYVYEDTGAISESGKSAADNVTVLNNLWRSNYLSMFRRTGALHKNTWSGNNVQQDASHVRGEADQRENIWAEAWHGKFDSSSAYGRSLSQNINGVQVGFDKLLNNKVAGGKVFTGFYLSKIDGSSTTASGKGDQDSLGIGAYASWLGSKGHFIDASFMTAKLKNDYHFLGNDGSGGLGNVKGKYDTWGYGLGLQYGYQSRLQHGWYLEPSTGIFVGHVDESNHSMSNKLGIKNGGYDTVTGKLGIALGKELPHAQGNVYADITAYKEFAGANNNTAYWGRQTRMLESAAGKDTWWEFGLGGNVKISDNGVFNLHLSKTTGSSVGNVWSINGGFNWSWGGFTPVKAKQAKVAGETTQSFAKAQTTTVVIGMPQVDNITFPQLGGATTVVVENSNDNNNNTENTYVANLDPATTSTDGNLNAFELGGLTVEAQRPDWEKNLSPGQVSVIYPKAFEGEQKHLPDLLDRVPGLFVQRISGDGHYTVARVRGATAGQVNVYVDGVLMNLNSESAVNLSTIPIDNVERVEVYRGYVPARFSGAPLGGVINIVTKKPQEVGGRITQGLRSYDGYTSQYELSAPLGSGSIMATYQRDIWQGDFPFRYQANDAYKGKGELYRRSNGYQNNNGMVKWQDNKWAVKAAWKDLDEELPRTVDNLHLDLFGNRYWSGWYDAEQKIKQQEFQVSRRDTIGNLDWGWRAYYLHQKKNYRAIGLLSAIDRGEIDESIGKSYPGQLWTDFESKKYGANLNAAYKMGGSHLLEVNFDYSHESLDADGSNWTTWDDSMAGLGRQFLRNYKIKEYHFTLQDSITLNSAGDFKFTPIFRADKVDMTAMVNDDKRWKYSGAAALQKQINKNWSVKTSWGTYYRHPNFYELFGDGATIKPNKIANLWDIGSDGAWETGSQFDFSVNWQGTLAKADTDTILTWFKRKAKNQLALWTPSVPNSTSSYIPMDDAEVHGLELTHTMKWKRLDFSVAGTWQEAEYTNLEHSNIIGGRKSWISYTPKWVWSARLDYLFPGDKLSVYTEYNYKAKQFLGSREGSGQSFMKSLQTVDLGFKYSFTKAWKLSAGVNDIFNKGYKTFQEYFDNTGTTSRDLTLPYPLVGRTYYATMEYSF